MGIFCKIVFLYKCLFITFWKQKRIHTLLSFMFKCSSAAGLIGMATSENLFFIYYLKIRL